MSTRMNSVMRVLSATLAAFLLPLTQATAGQPLHEVRGHAVVTLDPPAAIDQITINAAADDNGVVRGSVSVWPLVYLLNLLPPTPVAPDLTGWNQVFRLTELEVTGNVAHVGGFVIFDNRFPEFFLGCPVDFIVTDNGTGVSDPPDTLEVTLVPPCGGAGFRTILGGNFTVK
jgi:hypothetical protein